MKIAGRDAAARNEPVGIRTASTEPAMKIAGRFAALGAARASASGFNGAGDEDRRKALRCDVPREPRRDASTEPAMKIAGRTGVYTLTIERRWMLQRSRR